MFLDIRNFTSFSEHRAPSEVVSYLNTLLGEMITVVNANHGMINKFLGDGFMACFGAPLSGGKDARNAVKAAVEIVELVETLNRKGAIPPTRIGIGLHAGPAVTGSVGSDERKEYTIIGDTVNLASRVEQLNKQYGSVLIVTDSVWEAVKDEYAGKYLDPAYVKGRAEPVRVYALR
jgi:adenylate cyclase